MKKILYIIPGYQDTSRRKPYQSLATIARKKGYEVVFYNINWKKRLSPQVFPVPKNAVIFGFSLGAILARLVAQDYPCRHLILASMAPLYSFKGGKNKKPLVDLLGSRYIEDIAKNLKLKHLADKQTRMYGALEGGRGDIIVPNTEHELSEQYIKEIARIL